MARKNVLSPVNLATAQSLSTSFTTAPTIIDFQDNVAYQIAVTTTNSAGTFQVQVSLDYNPTTPNTTPNAGTWIPLDLSGGVPTVAAANDQIVISLNQLPYHAIRLAYASTTAGTGTCNITIMCKTVGA